MSTTYKIHPAIGIARVGNSDDYYLAPTTAGGLPVEQDGTTPVTAFRDGQNLLRKQAATFDVYIYDETTPEGRPATIGQDGIKDIQWTVHLANKKASWHKFVQLKGSSPASPYPSADDESWRNYRTTGANRKRFIIDPGPRTVRCAGGAAEADFTAKNDDNYPSTFPPAGLAPFRIDTLGKLVATSGGTLRVLGGHGNSGTSVAYDVTKDQLDRLQKHPQKAGVTQAVIDALRPIQDFGYDDVASFQGAVDGALTAAGLDAGTYWAAIESLGAQPRIDTYANNNFWYDDTSDGPVTATLIMHDGPPVPVDVGSWVLVGPPAFAPEILNMTSLYETMYDVFVQHFGIRPDLYKDGAWQQDYRPSFTDEIQPILAKPDVYRWVAAINQRGQLAHGGVAQEPQYSNFMDYMRPPTDDGYGQPRLMPFLAGDDPINGTRNYMALTETQFFLLSQFSTYAAEYAGGAGTGSSASTAPGPGAQLDRAVLENCVGGPFCPGIEMTWISRDPEIYQEPFRFKVKDVSQQLGLDWDNDPTKGLEPGDVTRYMALPWQADFNECSNQGIDNASVWWWPAQRPYQVFAEDDPSTQVYWTRPGVSQFDDDLDMVTNWKFLGFVIRQADGRFLEVQRDSTKINDES